MASKRTPRGAALLRVLVLVLASAALWPAAAAHAAGEGLGWSTPDYLSPDGAAGMAPSVATLADGSPVALWAEDDGSGFFPVVASKPLAGDWSRPSAIASEPIDAPSSYSFGPRFGVTPGGQYVAAWLIHRSQLIGGTPTSVPIVEGATGTISAGAAPGYAPHLIADADAPHGHAFSRTPRVLMTPEGEGVIAYPYTDCCGGVFLGLTALGNASPLGTPGLPGTSIASSIGLGGSNTDDSPAIPSVALPPLSTTWISSANNVEAAVATSPSYVLDGVPANSALLYRTTDPSSWGAGDRISLHALPLQGFGASVGVLATGDPIVTAPSGDGRLLLWRGGTVTTIDPDVGSVQSEAAIATAWDGSAAIAYQAIDRASGALVVRAVTLSAVGGVSDPVTLSSTGATARRPVVAYAPDGTVHVAWGQSGGALTGVDSAYKLPDHDWASSAVIHGLSDVGRVSMAVASDGFVTLVAQVNAGTGWRVAAFTHANPAAPRNVQRPQIHASADPAVAGTVLTCTPGTWTANPTSYRFEWLVDGASTGGPVASSAHTVTSGEIGHAIVCRVTASNPAGSGQAESDSVTPGGASAAGGSGGSDGSGGGPGTPHVRGVRAHGDEVTVTVGCPAGASSCPALTVQMLTTAGARASAAKAKAKRKHGKRRRRPKATVLGRVVARLHPGQTRKVTVKLNRAGRKLLKRHHGKLRVRVQVRAGKRTISTKAVTLHRPRPRHHRRHRARRRR